MMKTKKAKQPVRTIAQAKEEYELFRMQVVDEITRLFRSKNEDGWDIDVSYGIKIIEARWDEAYFVLDARRDKYNPRKISPYEIPYIWDIFSTPHYSGLRHYVILATTNAEMKPINKMLAELKTRYIEASMVKRPVSRPY